MKKRTKATWKWAIREPDGRAADIGCKGGKEYQPVVVLDARDYRELRAELKRTKAAIAIFENDLAKRSAFTRKRATR